ncbi:MAG TPA: hypothetical protein VGD43_19160 [Micromonospora sp.]
MRGRIQVGLGLAGLAAAFIGLSSVAKSQPAPHDHGATGSNGSGHAGHAGHTTGGATTVPAGLQLVQDGYRLEVVTPELAVGPTGDFRFRIVGPDGAPVRQYRPTHEKELHLIVARRDLSGFQHLHPTRGDDGVWSVPLRVQAAGQYRVFADFQPAARGEAMTLGADVPAPGDYRPVRLPSADRTAVVAGYTVTMAGDPRVGADATLAFSVSRDGRPVTDLEPYLGAYGHLVALRAGDLAYLHTHPDGAPGDGRTAAGPGITFHTQLPSVGVYRFFLDFQHAGAVHTAEFTVVAGGPGAGPGPTGSGG